MKQGAVVALLLGGGAVGAWLLSRRASPGASGAESANYGGGGYPSTVGGFDAFGGIDPGTGFPVDPMTGLPAQPTFGLSPDAETALVKDAQDANARWLKDQEDSLKRQEADAAQTQNQARFTDALNTAAIVGSSALWGVTLLPKAGRVLSSGINAVSGLGRGAPAVARAAAATVPAAFPRVVQGGTVAGATVRGLESISQGVQDLQARAQGQGPYAGLSQPGATTVAVANTAAATAVGAGSLGLASLDFNRGVSFLGLPVVTRGGRRSDGSHRVRLFGLKEVEF